MLRKFSALICRCNNCPPIELPPAVKGSLEQPSWPADCAELSFLCPNCKGMYFYSVRDTRTELALGPLPKWQNVVRITVPCWWAQRCHGLVETRTTVVFDAVLFREDALQIFAQSTAREITCSQGHTLNFSGYSPSPRDLAFCDELWLKSPA